MAKVIILCGKIASGKTTYANNLKKQDKAVILSYDDLMLKLYDNCLGNKHDETVYRISKFFFPLAEEIVAMDTDVILDFGFWSANERKSAKEYFLNKNIPCELHYIKTSEERRLSQLENRNKTLRKSSERVYIIEGDLLQRLDMKFEEPTSDEIDILIEFN